MTAGITGGWPRRRTCERGARHGAARHGAARHGAARHGATRHAAAHARGVLDDLRCRRRGKPGGRRYFYVESGMTPSEEAQDR